MTQIFKGSAIAARLGSNAVVCPRAYGCSLMGCYDGKISILQQQRE